MTNSVLFLADFVITFVAGQCLTRTFVQTCVSCKANCSASSGGDGGTVSSCRSVCLTKSDYACNIVDIELSSSTCIFYPTCTDVVIDGGYTAVRRTCTPDCLEVEVAKYSQQKGTCNELSTHTSISSVDKCLSLCLDTTFCRGATYSNTHTCELHTCNTWEYGGNDFTYMQLKCAGDTTTTRRTTITTLHTTIKARDTSPTMLFSSMEITQVPKTPTNSSTASMATAPPSSQLSTSNWKTPPFSSVITRRSKMASTSKAVSTIFTNTIKPPVSSTSPFPVHMTPSITQTSINTSISTTKNLIKYASAKTTPFNLSITALTPPRTSKFPTESLLMSMMITSALETSTIAKAPALATSLVTQRSATSTFKTPTSVDSTYRSPNTPIINTKTLISLTLLTLAKTSMPQSVSSLETNLELTTNSAHQPSSDHSASVDNSVASMSTTKLTLREDIRNDVGFFENTINIAVFASIAGLIIVTGMGFGIWQLIIRKGLEGRNTLEEQRCDSGYIYKTIAS